MVFIAGEASPSKRRGERWLDVTRSTDVPDEVSELLLGFRTEGGRLVPTGIHIRTTDAASGELIRSLPIGRLQRQALEGADHLGWLDKPKITAERGAGRAGLGDDFLDQIYDLYQYALNVAPGRHITWMFTEGIPEHQRPENLKTVRDWVRQAERRASGLQPKRPAAGRTPKRSTKS